MPDLASLLIASEMTGQGHQSRVGPLPATQRITQARVQLPGGSALTAKSPERSQSPTVLPQHLHSALPTGGARSACWSPCYEQACTVMQRKEWRNTALNQLLTA